MNLYLQSLIQRRDDLACLEYPFTKEEIDDVVRKMMTKCLDLVILMEHLYRSLWDITFENLYNI
jgi:hypothetical protein